MDDGKGLRAGQCWKGGRNEGNVKAEGRESAKRDGREGNECDIGICNEEGRRVTREREKRMGNGRKNDIEGENEERQRKEMSGVQLKWEMREVSDDGK